MAGLGIFRLSKALGFFFLLFVRFDASSYEVYTGWSFRASVVEIVAVVIRNRAG